MDNCSPMQHKVFTIPNVLSFFRLMMIPGIVYSFLAMDNPLLTAVLLLASGLTDIVDGFIARRFQMISDLGKILDPVADKLTQCAMLFCLVKRFPLMLLPLLLLIAKEIFAALLGLKVIRQTGQVRGAVWHGKLNTALIYAMMLLHLLWADIPAKVSTGAIVLCCGVILLSCAGYTRRDVMLLKKGGSDLDGE